MPNLSSGHWITRCMQRVLLTYSSSFFLSCNSNYKQRDSDCASVCSCTEIDYCNSCAQHHRHWQAWRWDPFQRFATLWQNLSPGFMLKTLFPWLLISSCCWIFYFKKNSSVGMLLASAGQVFSGCSFYSAVGSNALAGNKKKCFPFLCVISSVYG